jgi:hypothetical protein
MNKQAIRKIGQQGSLSFLPKETSLSHRNKNYCQLKCQFDGRDGKKTQANYAHKKTRQSKQDMQIKTTVALQMSHTLNFFKTFLSLQIQFVFVFGWI